AAREDRGGAGRGRVIRVVVPGAAGKMGRMVVDALAAAPGVMLAGATERPGHEALGAALGGVTLGAGLRARPAGGAVYIDFTAPEATTPHVVAAAERGVAAIIGTTGLPAEARAAIMHAGARIPIVVAPNFSLGVNLVCGLVEQAARLLGGGFDME